MNKLQQLAATMFGKENALYVPSGTMGNLLSILSHARPGEEVLSFTLPLYVILIPFFTFSFFSLFPKIMLGDQSHIYLNEQGGTASLAGVIPRVVRNEPDGTIPVEVIKYLSSSFLHLYLISLFPPLSLSPSPLFSSSPLH